MTIISPKDRIKEERKRLKLTQAVIADICGISREMWSKYERGLAKPCGKVLASFANAGEKQLGLILTKEEKAFLDLYRNATITIKVATRGALTAGTAHNDHD